MATTALLLGGLAAPASAAELIAGSGIPTPEPSAVSDTTVPVDAPPASPDPTPSATAEPVPVPESPAAPPPSADPEPTPSATATPEPDAPPAPAPSETAPAKAPATRAAPEAAEPRIVYEAHLQGQGWQGVKQAGEEAGTATTARLEALRMRLEGAPAGSTITYQTAVRTLGWTSVVADWATSGTTGRSLPVEATRILLRGPIAQTHDIWYRMYVTDKGWMGWVKGNGKSGTVNSNLYATSFQALLLPKGAEAPGSTTLGFAQPVIHYRAHVQRVGWQSAVANGGVAGTTGRSLRVEGLSSSVSGAPFAGSVQYTAHVQRVGWQSWYNAGTNAGTTGKSLRVEALKFRLTGDLAARFDVYYRAHVQSHGWLAWTKNGEPAGSAGRSLRVEAYQVLLRPKGVAGPATGTAYLPPPKYQTPGSFAKISWTGIPAPAGAGFTLGAGREGAKVKVLADRFGQARPTQWVDDAFMASVRSWQGSHGLPKTGVVDKRTWTSMGLSASSWTALDSYRYPLKAKATMTRSQLIEAMIATALDYRGSRYVWGGANDPGFGADCVGMVMQALYSVGLNPTPSTTVTHTTPGNTTPREIYKNPKFKHVPYSQRQRGDLIFQANNPRDPNTVRHVQMYLGNGQVMEIVHIGGVARAENITYPASMNMPTVVRPLP
ncbi:NlpC/P60 family protein [Microbacterium sp. NPDC096154]|uniref:NlpC/P60 family protein n=1 Tax=Microbacterium sp. NPDC096154 TaxID=3155549 RepID=UPI00333444FA